MYLFMLLTFLTFLNSFASKIALFILKLLPHDNSMEELSSQIVQLKRELSLIPMVDEFAKHARLQRKIIKLQEERKSIAAKNVSKEATMKLMFLIVTYTLTSITLLLLVWSYRGEVIAELPAEWLWPVPNIFNWFGGTPGCISVPSWIVLSSVSSKIIATSF